MTRAFPIAAGALLLGAAAILSPVAVAPLAAQPTAAQAAALETRAFIVENMYCALCPVTVKKAMERVKGVRSVAVDFEAKTARVVFDPAIASIEAIAAASTDAGYPARPAG